MLAVQLRVGPRRRLLLLLLLLLLLVTSHVVTLTLLLVPKALLGRVRTKSVAGRLPSAIIHPSSNAILVRRRNPRTSCVPRHWRPSAAVGPPPKRPRNERLVISTTPISTSQLGPKPNGAGGVAWMTERWRDKLLPLGISY